MGFGLGFVTAALIFGFWGSSATAVAPLDEELAAAPALDGIDTTLEALINEGQDVSEREKKAANRIALYNDA